jgi:pimeloyl-ACP methyl ester carboxylesterase
MPTVTSNDGTPVWFSDSAGDGPAVVLLHGFSMTSRSHFEVRYGRGADGRIGPSEAPSLHRRLVDGGARVVAVDARGHGRSGRSDDPARYRGDVHANDVSAVIDELGVDSVDIVGYSMGAETAMRMFGLDGRLRSVALCGTGPPRTDGAKAANLRTIGDCFRHGTWNEHPELKVWRAQARLDSDHDFSSLAASAEAYEEPSRERLGRAVCPVLVLNGGNDDDGGRAGALAALIPGARAVVVGHADHAMACSDEAFLTVLLDFLTANR